MKNKKSSKGFVYWFPRIGGIIYVLFLLLFSFDVFGTGAGFWLTLGAFLMHSIPSILLFIVLLISWKHEIVGAVIFMLFALAYVILAVRGAPSPLMGLSWSLTIALPTFLIGLCFLIGWKKKRQVKARNFSKK